MRVPTELRSERTSEGTLCTIANGESEMSQWVMSVVSGALGRCPLLPRKRRCSDLPNGRYVPMRDIAVGDGGT